MTAPGFYKDNNCLWFLETPRFGFKARKIVKHFPSVERAAE